MRTRKNTEPTRDYDYNCFGDAVGTIFWVVPLGLALVACGRNPVALVLVGIVVFFCYKISTSE